MTRNAAALPIEAFNSLTREYGASIGGDQCVAPTSSPRHDDADLTVLQGKGCSHDPAQSPSLASSEGERDDTAPELLQMARAFYRAFCLQQSHFPFANARDGWLHILLDSFINRAEQRRVSITSACLSSGLPQTTALRHIQLLVDRGLLERKEALHDQRVAYLELTSTGYFEVKQYLTACRDDRSIRKYYRS